MKRLSLIAGALLALALASTAATATTTTVKPIAFVGKYAGTATTQVTNNIAAITAKGTGTGTQIGAGTITGTGSGNTSVQPCVPFTGTGVMTGPKGALTFKVNPGSSGCGDQAGEQFTVSGKATVLAGTGALAKRTGTLRMTGTYDRTNGAFTVKLSGSLTGAGTAAPANTVLKITAGAKTFSRKALTAPAGKITIVMKNGSPLARNVAIRNGVTAKSKIIKKGKVVKKGGSSTVTVTLRPGKYRYVCTVSGLEAAGMWGILTVK